MQEDKELSFGPNGALVFCMEYLVQNLDWLHEQLSEGEDDYFLFDCPGQSLVLPITSGFFSHLSLGTVSALLLCKQEFGNPSVSCT